MKTCLLYAFLFLALLGTRPASGNTVKEGVDVVDGPEESFLRRLTINDDIRNKNSIIELHLTSIDLLVSVRVDAFSNIHSVTTSYLPGNVARNEEKETENIATMNQAKNTAITNTSLPRPENFPTLQIIQKESAGNNSTWLEKAWSGFSGAMQSIIKWLCVGIEWPKDINSDKFARRTVTCAADDSHSMFNLDITDMEERTFPVTSIIPLTTLTNINPWSLKTHNVVPKDCEVFANQTANKTVLASPLERENGNIMSSGTQSTVTDVKENESSQRHEPIEVFMEHHDSEPEWTELLPQFTTLNYYGTNPEVMSPQAEIDDSVFPGSLDTVDLNDKDDDYIYWPGSPPEFTSVGYYGVVPSKTVHENHEYSDNISPKSDDNPAIKGNVSRERLFMGNRSKEDGESCLLINSQIETSVLMDKRNTISTSVDKETLPDSVEARNRTIKHEIADKCIEDVQASAVTEIASNGTMDNQDLMCPNQPVNNGSWMKEDDNGVCIKEHENLPLDISDMTPLISHTRYDTPLQAATRVKKSNDKWMAELVINETALCLAGSNKSGPETNYCSRNASKRSSDSTWFITKLWNRGVAFVGWRKSSGVPLQATRVKKTQGKWMAQEPINVFEICMASSNKSGPETEFCTNKAIKRSVDTTGFPTKLWNRGVAGVRWLKSNETQTKARNLTNYYWTRFQITIINWTWQDTFDVMMTIWLIDYNFMAVYLAICYTKELIRLKRLRRERELEEERERLRKLEHELELERERAAQLPKVKPLWRPKPPKQKRPNYCGRLQNWN